MINADQHVYLMLGVCGHPFAADPPRSQWRGAVPIETDGIPPRGTGHPRGGVPVEKHLTPTGVHPIPTGVHPMGLVNIYTCIIPCQETLSALCHH